MVVVPKFDRCVTEAELKRCVTGNTVVVSGSIEFKVVVVLISLKIEFDLVVVSFAFDTIGGNKNSDGGDTFGAIGVDLLFKMPLA